MSSLNEYHRNRLMYNYNITNLLVIRPVFSNVLYSSVYCHDLNISIKSQMLYTKNHTLTLCPVLSLPRQTLFKLCTRAIRKYWSEDKILLSWPDYQHRSMETPHIFHELLYLIGYFCYIIAVHMKSHHPKKNGSWFGVVHKVMDALGGGGERWEE